MKTIYPSLLKTSKAFTLALAMLVLAPGAQAQTAANWNFNSSLSGTPGSNITAGAALLGSAIPSSSFNGGSEFFGQDGWPSGAIDLNAYLQFSVSPAIGHYLVLNTVSMIVRRSNTGSPAGAGPNNWTLRSSLDGYTTDLATNSMTYNYATFTVPLPAAFQTLSSSVTFRLYGYNTTINSGGSSRFVYDNISIQGQAISGVLAQQSLDLTAKASANAINLKWQSEGFAAGTDFAIERSTDGASFTTIDHQTSGTNQTASYQYSDLSLPSAAKFFYRVLATQPDGATLRSAVTAVTFQAAAIAGAAIRSVAVSGSSVRTALHLGTSGNYQLNIWSSDGRALYRTTISGQAGDQVADLAIGNYPHGLYVLTVSKEGVNTSRQFVL